MTDEALVFCVTFKDVLHELHSLQAVGTQADGIAHVICCRGFHVGYCNQFLHAGVDGLQLQQRHCRQ